MCENCQSLDELLTDGFIPSSVTYCENCGYDWSELIDWSDRDLNYCPICGNELIARQ